MAYIFRITLKGLCGAVADLGFFSGGGATRIIIIIILINE